MEKKRTTEELNRILEGTKPSGIGEYFSRYGDRMNPEEHAFSDFMRACLEKKDILLQDMFLAADISEGYGYKLISGEKHTRQRDIIIKLCLGGHFSFTETNKALGLYGMAPLSPRDRRDVVLTIAVNNRKYEIWEVDEMLEKNGFRKLYAGSSGEGENR